MDAIWVDFGCTKVKTEWFGDRFELTNQILPFTYAQVIQVFALAEPAKSRRRELCLLLFDVIPKIQQCQEVTRRVGKSSVQLVSSLALFEWPLARILNRESSDNHHDLTNQAGVV